MVAASARRSTGIRLVRATVPLPTGTAWAAIAAASRLRARRARARSGGSAAPPPRSARRTGFLRGAAFAAGLELAGVRRVCALDLELGADAIDVLGGREHPAREHLRPRLSFTVQLAPAAFTRRVSPASPGGSSSQPSGDAQDLAFRRAHGARLGPGGDFTALLAHGAEIAAPDESSNPSLRRRAREPERGNVDGSSPPSRPMKEGAAPRAARMRRGPAAGGAGARTNRCAFNR